MGTQKKYLVVGAIEDGIGDAVTERLLSDGHEVIGTFDPEKEDKSKEKSNTENLTLSKVDHSSKKSVVDFMSKIENDCLDGIIVVQMMFEMENPSEFSHELWEQLVFVNLTMPNIVTHEGKSKLKEEGAVVFVTSTEAFMGSFGASAYASTKAAIHNLVKTHANNLGPRKIRVNAVVPGWIGGVMDTDEVFNMSRKITPLGRLGDPKEVAAACAFMVSGEASFITGTTLVVDGGYSGVDTISKFEFEASQ